MTCLIANGVDLCALIIRALMYANVKRVMSGLGVSSSGKSAKHGCQPGCESSLSRLNIVTLNHFYQMLYNNTPAPYQNRYGPGDMALLNPIFSTTHLI